LATYVEKLSALEAGGSSAANEFDKPTATNPARSPATAKPPMVCRRETLIFMERVSWV
jgi:hypothetical protein